MKKTVFNPEAFLNLHVPEKVQFAILKGVIGRYLIAADKVSAQYESPEASDLLPNVRLAEIETLMVELATEFDCLEVFLEKNSNKSRSHRNLVCGDIILTQSYTEGNKLPRKAIYRNTLARSTQGLLFEKTQQYVPDDARLYGIITHSPVSRKISEPYFVNIVFPDINCVRILGQVNLLTKFRDQITIATEVEIIESTTSPVLKETAIKEPKPV